MKLRNITLAAMFAAIVCILTYVVKIPLHNGYANIGDVCVLVVGMFLPPFYAFLASGIGTMLSDLFSGYAIYAPVTFIIKGCMSLIVIFLSRLLNKKMNKVFSLIICFIIAEVFMAFGYYLYEGILYGFQASLVNIPFNLLQGGISIIIAILLYHPLSKIKK